MSAAIPRHQRAFWEKMATKYPLPFEEKSLVDTIRLIELVEARGVQLDGASILDIGCGTGRQSLLLAQRAAKVLDFSQGMVDCFEWERQKHGITNAAVMCCAWNELDIAAQRLEKGLGFHDPGNARGGRSGPHEPLHPRVVRVYWLGQNAA